MRRSVELNAANAKWNACKNDETTTAMVATATKARKWRRKSPLNHNTINDFPRFRFHRDGGGNCGHLVGFDAGFDT